MNRLSEFDQAIEAYLGRLAGDVADNKTRQAEAVRIHYQSKEAAALVPIIQSLATGFFLGLAVGVIAILAEIPRAWAWALVTMVFTWAAAWLFLLRDWRGIVLNRLETITDRDLNGDLVIGRPSPPQPLRVEVVEDGGRSIKLIDLPASEEQLTALAKGLLAGKSFTEGEWIGAGAPFTRAAFVQLRSEMIRRGLATWIIPGTPTRGARLTARGRAVCKQIMFEYAPLPPSNDPESEEGI